MCTRHFKDFHDFVNCRVKWNWDSALFRIYNLVLPAERNGTGPLLCPGCLWQMHTVPKEEGGGGEGEGKGKGREGEGRGGEGRRGEENKEGGGGGGGWEEGEKGTMNAARVPVS